MRALLDFTATAGTELRSLQTLYMAMQAAAVSAGTSCARASGGEAVVRLFGRTWRRAVLPAMVVFDVDYTLWCGSAAS